VADEFVRVRLTRIAGADLNLFDFDYDLTWVGFFLSPEEKIYGRYGGRDASGPDDRQSLAGLNYAMKAALAAHRREPLNKFAERAEKPLRVENYPAAKQHRGCIHCHQVYEFRRDLLKKSGKWTREDVWSYPLPENVGLSLEIDEGNKVQSVTAGSPAAKAGVRPGDYLETLNGIPTASFADAQYALHRAPARGTIPLSWRRDKQTQSGSLELAEGWRKTNLTWRPSMLDILPTLSVYGDDLTAAEKKALGLSAKQLAFRQQKIVHSTVKAVDLHGGDVVVGIDGQSLEMTLDQFLAYVRRNYLVGDRVTLNVIRDGKRLNLGP
jgi:hypothetical protein